MVIETTKHLHKINCAPLSLESYRAINQTFITRAINQWDIDGQGSFEDFIRCRVNLYWHELAEDIRKSLPSSMMIQERGEGGFNGRPPLAELQ